LLGGVEIRVSIRLPTRGSALVGDLATDTEALIGM